jgi:ribosomal protein S14/HKD family nuclease
MATFMTTAEIGYQLENLLKEAKERVFLVSPYIKFRSRIENLLKDCNSRGLDIQVVYRGKDAKPEEERMLRSLSSVRLRSCNELHAKCYLNESRAILTSMNLHDYSQANNEEMGVLIDRAADAALFNAVDTEVRRLIRVAVPQNVEQISSVSDVIPNGAQTDSSPKSLLGHCIRCGVSIPFDPKKPLCKADFGKWAQYEDSDYEEKYCHRCGKPHSTSMNKPLCRDCFKASK